MPNNLTPAVVEIFLCDPTGVRIDCLDYVTDYSYAQTINTPAPFSLRLPSKFDRKKIKLDNIVEIWRGFGPGTLKLDYCGFLRDWKFGDEMGVDYTDLFGWSTLYLMPGRVVARTGGWTGAADDLQKGIVKDELGSDAAAGRDLTSVGGGFTIQANLTDGQTSNKVSSWRNVLELCQELSDESAQLGTELYFDIVPDVSSAVTGALAFQLRTFTDQRGSDRTWDSSKPVFIGKEWGNFQNGEYGEYHSDEINYVYALGKGEGYSRKLAEVSDTARMGLSIWNRREGIKNASQATYSDITQVESEANAYMYENRPKFFFGGDIVETPAFRYGRDWGFGDRVTAIYAGIQKDAMIKSVLVQRDSSGQENITARLEIEE